MPREVFGVSEWAAHSINCVSGCSHNCRYCYARGMMVKFGRCTEAEWPLEKVRWREVRKRRKLLDGTVMFPTTHDITPAIADPCATVLSNLLAAGNRVLLVSKPHLSVIRWLLGGPRRMFVSQLLLRFTIGSDDTPLLASWEPGAPSFDERLEALAWAHAEGFETSVSIEPMLDAENIDRLVSRLAPHVSHSIWIGRMNHIGCYVRGDASEIEQTQTADVLGGILRRLNNNPLVRWKESMKKLAGFAVSTTAGLDR